jgi:cephalosporin hydroxylase
VTTRKPSFWKYLENRVEFEIDDSLDNKLLMSVAPRGFLRRKM